MEIEKIIVQYDIGSFIENHDPGHIASCIKASLNNDERRAKWKLNLETASKELCWQNEEKVILEMLKKASQAN